MLTEEQKKKLNASLDATMIKDRKQSGRMLSYVEGWYVIDRLNEILGPGGWSYDVPGPVLVCEDERDGGTDANGKPKGMRWHVTYNARCVLKVGDAVIGDWGSGHGIDKDRGLAHESAIKEAATDALKRCAKSLGRSMGLALYDKEQEHVAEPQRQPPRVVQAATPPPEVADVLRAFSEAGTRDDHEAARKLAAAVYDKAAKADQEMITKASKAALARIKESAA